MKGLASSTISLFCLLAILIKGHQGFFIKHSVSGLCLKVEDTPFNGEPNKGWGANYYVKFYDGCLHSHARFRYVEGKFVHNFGKIGTFLGRRYDPGEKDHYSNRYIVYRNRSSTASFVRKPEFALRHKSGTLKIYDGTYCATPSKSTKPFDGAYPVKTMTCDQDLQKFTFGSVTDKDSTMTDVNCASSQKMEVVKAEFGEFSDGNPFVYNNDTKCSSFALCFVKAHCDGKISCNMTADSNLFKLNQCPKTSRQLYMEYNCVDTPGTAITTVSKIRLSQAPNRGYIEVYDGTTWIPADDKTWSKEKEVALCHHLGFNNTKSGSGNKGATIQAGQELASGDMYCYGTQPTSTSCCAQLESSTLTQNAKIPNVKCVICNEPLLEDSGKFPDRVFTASDANGYKSRVDNDGWCPTSIGSKYLQIDLQREYYITHIATFGDKAQTNWLESYSLQYSRTLAGLGSSTAKTVTANHNAYQASITRLDIARARYLRIIPNQAKDFCLRVQLCGYGLQGFFIKHSESGLCVKPKQDRFSGGPWGTMYIVEFHDGCLHPDAQFHFIDNEYVQNIAKDGTLITRNKTMYLDRFLVYQALVTVTKQFVRQERFRFKQKMSGSLSMYSGTYCAIPDGSTTPSEGTYLKRTTTCNTDIQKFTFGSVTNKDSPMIDVNCASSQKMEVVKTEFGQFSDGKPFVYNNDTKCSSFALCIVKAHCDGKISCNMAADSNLFKLSQCPKTSSQLYMEYNCVDTPGTVITTVSKIRLHQAPNQGYIEVFYGTTWIAADDKTWSKEKEVALCHHLGFINTKSGSGNKGATIRSGQMLASGDMYCYGTQPTNTSCCAQLVPSTLTQNAKIPNVKCLICNEPLLEDTVKFPNASFSASEGDGHEARVTNNGWCPTNSGSKYLQIDLQREYYITYIATFGDKAQTKWLESYSLQYSRTLAGLNSSTMKTVTANHNAYQASVVKLDIPRARYLKVIPKEGKDFCLRVELCGRAVPGPVQKIVFDTINARSALVSWLLPQNDQQSQVTYFLVFLNVTLKGNVTRSADKNQYTLDDLKPYSNYKVTIKAANVYGAGDGISKTFKTKEAAPDGPPSNVAVVFRNSSSLNVSWQPPSDKSVWNGIITRYKLCNSAAGKKPEICVSGITGTSCVMTKLQPGTEYLFRVFAGTKIDYGALSGDINATTNQEPVKPSKKTYYSLGINLKKPRDKVQSVLVIVQASTISSKTTDEYELDELKPFMNGSSAPYVTAGLNASGLPRTFVIGDGMWYNLSAASYFNQPLKENTDYIVFLRFIESKDIYYSTDWSSSVRPTGNERTASFFLFFFFTSFFYSRHLLRMGDFSNKLQGIFQSNFVPSWAICRELGQDVE